MRGPEFTAVAQKPEKASVCAGLSVPLDQGGATARRVDSTYARSQRSPISSSPSDSSRREAARDSLRHGVVSHQEELEQSLGEPGELIKVDVATREDDTNALALEHLPVLEERSHGHRG